jgi:hypothetical protein
VTTTSSPRFARLTGGQRWTLMPFAALVAALAWSALAPALRGDGVPETGAWVRALESVKGELAPGDTVWVQPPWRDDVVDALERAGVPAGVDVTVALAMPHGQEPGRTLLVRDPSAPLPRAYRERFASATPKRVAGLDVAFLGAAKTGKAGDIDYLSRLATARVHVEKKDGRTVRCAWSDLRDRHICSGMPDWVHVGIEPQVVHGKSQRCAWSHPITGGKIVVRWEDQRLPKVLHLGHALSDTAAGNPNGSPVTMTIRADDKEILKSVRTNARGFKRDKARVPAGATSLELEVTTPFDGARHYCWQLTGGAE